MAGGDDADELPKGGLWLTYRYRFGGEGVAEAAGTIKAPSFLTAARRLVDRRLADRLGASPAYLRLRAAGEEEVLVRVTRADAGSASPALEVVPPATYAFADPSVDP